MAKDKLPKSGSILGKITKRILGGTVRAEISGNVLRAAGAKPVVDKSKQKAGFAPGMSNAARAKRAKGK